jgi:hypothetical protein
MLAAVVPFGPTSVGVEQNIHTNQSGKAVNTEITHALK